MRSIRTTLPFVFLAATTFSADALAGRILGTIEPRAEGEAAVIGFDSVATAREVLMATHEKTAHTDRDGWLQIEDRRANALWSFVPEDHPAYPSVIRRTTDGRGRTLKIDMRAICEAEQGSCEALMQRMVRMNEIARRRLVDNLPRGAGARPDQTPIGGLLASGRGP
jgi:hypothetical protein